MFSHIIGYHAHLTQLPPYDWVSATESSLATYLNHHPTYPGQSNNCLDYYDKGMLIAFGVDSVLSMESNTNLNQAFSTFFHEFVHWLNTPPRELGYTTDPVLEHFDGVLPGRRTRLARVLPGGRA